MATNIQRVRRGVETPLDLKPTTDEWLKSGYHFLGWNTNQNATTPTYLDGAYGTFQTDTILHAIWQKDYAIVGAFGARPSINGYGTDTTGGADAQRATQRVADQDLNWVDCSNTGLEDRASSRLKNTSLIPVMDVAWSSGKFIRTIYVPYMDTNHGREHYIEYSTDGSEWILATIGRVAKPSSPGEPHKPRYCCAGQLNG